MVFHLREGGGEAIAPRHPDRRTQPAAPLQVRCQLRGVCDVDRRQAEGLPPPACLEQRVVQIARVAGVGAAAAERALGARARAALPPRAQPAVAVGALRAAEWLRIGSALGVVQVRAPHAQEGHVAMPFEEGRRGAAEGVAAVGKLPRAPIPARAQPAVVGVAGRAHLARRVIRCAAAARLLRPRAALRLVGRCALEACEAIAPASQFDRQLGQMCGARRSACGEWGLLPRLHAYPGSEQQRDSVQLA